MGNAQEVTSPGSAGNANAISKTLERLGLPSSVSVVMQDVVYSKDFGRKVREFRLSNECEILLSVESDQLLRFRDSSDEEIPSNLRRENAINRETALRNAKTFLSRLGKTVDLNKSKVSLVDGADRTQGDLLGCNWLILYDYEYEGYKCLGYRMVMKVSGYSGKILHYSDNPVVMTKKPNVKLTEDKAVDTAKEFLRSKLPDGAFNTTLKESSLMIVRPNNWWRRSIDEDLLSESQGVLAWLVVLRNDKESSHPPAALVYVDAETGEILGGAN